MALEEQNPLRAAGLKSGVNSAGSAIAGNKLRETLTRLRRCKN
jgi:hypothetical protein